MLFMLKELAWDTCDVWVVSKSMQAHSSVWKEQLHTTQVITTLVNASVIKGSQIFLISYQLVFVDHLFIKL